MTQKGGWRVERLWEGERVFIIAGGSSVPRVDIRKMKLRGKVIAIKDAAFLRPDADLFFYAGAQFHLERPDVWAAFTGPLRVKRAVDEGVPEGVRQVRRRRVTTTTNGLSTDPQFLGGHCCGGSALNLAFHLGAREIILIGYDLRGRHWNPAHPVPFARSLDHERHRRSIDAMAGPLARAGVKVVNTSPISALHRYERRPLAEIA